MADRHKHTPLALRFPEGDLLWLRDYAEKTGQPVRRVVLAAVAEYRAAHDPDWGDENPA
jgi:hypothetical protein